MATAHYYQQSFDLPFWQHIVDFNATLIEIPLGLLSATHSGFAFENVDGTYTVFVGTDIVMGAAGPVSGTVDRDRIA